MSLVTHLLKQLADVYRRTEVSDGQGGVTYSYALLQSGRRVTRTMTTTSSVAMSFAKARIVSV
jgi:hypothetical protein